MAKNPVQTRLGGGRKGDWKPTPTNLGNWSADLEDRITKLEERVAHVDDCIRQFLHQLDGLGDEVRTRRLVVIDGVGRERIFTKMSSDDRGAALHVRTPGGETQVEIVACDDNGDAYAGVYIFDAWGEAVAELGATEVLGARGRTAEPELTMRTQGDRLTGYTSRKLDVDTVDVILYKSGLLGDEGDE